MLLRGSTGIELMPWA